MNKLEFDVLKKLIDENGPKVLSVLGLRIRGDKDVIKYACKKDKNAAIYASDSLKQDSVFIFSAVGYDVETFAELFKTNTAMQTQRASTIICLANNPVGFKDIAFEDFADTKYINACKRAIQYCMNKKLSHRKEKGLTATKEDVDWAENIVELVAETEKKAKIMLASKSAGQKKTNNAQIKDLSKSIRKF